MPKVLTRLLVGFAIGAAAGWFAIPGTASAAGSLRASADVSYAPLEFYGPPSHTMQGFDVDLIKAIGAKLAENMVVTNHQFDSILQSVQQGRADVGISAISDTRAREKQVDFVDYLLVGSGMLVPEGNPRRIFNLGGLCGVKVDVQKGTSQEVALQDQSQRCEDLHLGKITLVEYATDDQAFAAFQAGKSDVHVTDYPVVAYLAKTTGGGNTFQVAGRQFALVPFGIAVRKGNAGLRAQLVAALHGVIQDGTYEKLLKKWGLEQGALRSAPVNAGTLFEK
ncbi:MAG: ABC transporter substrate-binding protein [Candidatus Baltobacteraceae bacterium]